MNKKKVICGAVILTFLALMVWIFIPYLFTWKNLISRYNYDYTYTEAYIYDFDKLENSTHINNDGSGTVDKLTSVIDELPLKRTWKSNDWYNLGISFVATYKEGESNIYTKEVFSVRFYKDNVMGFREKPQYKEKFYKIQDGEFDIKKVIQELQESKH